MAADTDRSHHPPPHTASAGHDDNPLHNEDVAHEHSDVNVRAILIFLLVLTTVVGLSAAAMGGVFVLLERQAAKNDPPLSPLAMPAVEMPKTTTGSATFGNVATGPRLLANEPLALEEHRSRARKMLDTGEWVDRNAGIGRIPIADAKAVLLHKGLPTRAGDPIDPRLGTRAAAMSDASSGRLAVMKPQATGGVQPPTQPVAPPKVERKH